MAARRDTFPKDKDDRPGGRSLRADGAANRARLLSAASAMMREFGGDVPLEAIAERAGTTRGTVYRNFADRRELYLAVLDDDLETIGARLARGGDADLLAVMKELSGMMVVYDRFLDMLPSLAEANDFTACQSKIVRLIDAPLERARGAGRVREDITSADVLIACRMVAAGWRLDGAADEGAAIERRLSIVLRGLDARD